MNRTMSSANSESFLFFFFTNLNFFVFIYLFIYLSIYLFISSLTVVARTFKAMLKSCGESGQPCLVPDFRGNAFNFSPLKILFAGFPIYGFYCVAICSFYPCFLETYHKEMLNFVKISLHLLG